jgi:hypothetical protein
MTDINNIAARSHSLINPSSRQFLITLIGRIIVCGFGISVYYHYFQSIYHTLGYPYNTFLFRPVDRFSDFFDCLRVMNPSLGGPYWDPQMCSPAWQGFNGWPFHRLVFYPFLPFGLRWGLVLWLSLFIGVFWAWGLRYLKSDSPVVTIRNLFVFSFLTYPFLFTIDRANPEVLVFVFLAIFFSCNETPRHRYGLLALTAAIAMKSFPGVYAILLLCNRRIREFIMVCLLAIGVNFAAAAVQPGGFVANTTLWLFTSTRDYQATMAVGNEGLLFNNTLWGLAKIGLMGLHHLLHPTWQVARVCDRLQIPYLIVCFLLFTLLAVYVVRREKILWKRVLLLAFAMILLPYVSADYRLIHVFFPLCLFIQSEERGRFAGFHAVMFSLLLIPKDYVRLPIENIPIPGEVSIQVILNPLIMLGMCLAIIWEGLSARTNPPTNATAACPIRTESAGHPDPADAKGYCSTGKVTFDDETAEEAPPRRDRGEAT